MPVKESQIRATKKYEDKSYFKTLVRFKKEDEEAIRAAAGKSLNGFIVAAVMEKVNGRREDTGRRSGGSESITKAS